MEDKWKNIVESAVKAATSGGKPVSGAKLKQAISEEATKAGEKYPELGHESEKLGDFIKRFPDSLIILRRPGQDFLVAPADQPELLTQSNNYNERAILRKDVFDAFTKIGMQPYWYDPATGVFELTSAKPAEETGWVKVESATQDSELKGRKAFAQSLGNSASQKVLDLALAGTKPLADFSTVVRQARLGSKWHKFRFDLIVSRIRAWCSNEGVAWQDSWLESEATNSAAIAHVFPDDRIHLQKLVGSLSEADLQRISVPLDVVLKLMRG